MQLAPLAERVAGTVIHRGDLNREGYTDVHQAQIGQRMAEVISCLHPIFVELRGQAAQIKR